MNYDSLAEHALGSRQSFRDFQSYLATTNRPVSLLHPHGTSRWFEAPLGFTEVEPSPSDGGVEVLANGTTLIAIGRRGDVWHNPEGHELVPAISIPMRGDFTSKTRWPQSQLEEFERFGPKVTRIVSIGWAARDQHILELLGKHVPRDAPVHVVSMGDADTIARRFRGVGFSSVTHESNGFSTFCDSTSTPSSGLDTIFGVGAAGAVDPPPS